MYFASDNCAGASAKVLTALEAANTGYQISYGGDEISVRVTERFAELFERDVGVVQVATGTAANAVALSGLVPPYGAILCHEEAHIMTDECGAPELFTGGAKLLPLPGEGAKLSPTTVLASLQRLPLDNQHHTPPRVLSITQATECGLVYTPDEITALSEIAKAYGLALHMDGARFANAVAALGCTPAETSWEAGVDVLSFGATKNGCLAAEAVVVFDKAETRDLIFRRKRGGHLVSKSRFIAAQLEAYLAEGHWLELAAHANRMAARLGVGIEKSGVARLCWPVQANEVFAVFDRTVDARLKAAGAIYFEWASKGHTLPKHIGGNEVLARFVCSFATGEDDVDQFLHALTGKTAAAAE